MVPARNGLEASAKDRGSLAPNANSMKQSGNDILLEEARQTASFQKMRLTQLSLRSRFFPLH